MTPDARQAVRRAVLDLMRAPLTVTVADPMADPLGAITAASALARAAAGAVRDYARMAREAGRSWREIGEAMGRPDPDWAFLTVAEQAGRYPSLAWTCPSCRQLVTDRGPEMGNPLDSERGHAEGCARFAGTVAEWEASWADE